MADEMSRARAALGRTEGIAAVPLALAARCAEQASAAGCLGRLLPRGPIQCTHIPGHIRTAGFQPALAPCHTRSVSRKVVSA